MSLKLIARYPSFLIVIFLRPNEESINEKNSFFQF